MLTSAPTVGVYKLFHLDDSAAQSGLLQLGDGSLLWDGTVFSAWVGGKGVGTEYFFKINYHGDGDCGPCNDIQLEWIPEPATLGLLSLGGLILFRRRRA